MIAEAIDRILKLGEVQEITIDGRGYTSRAIIPVQPPVQSQIHVRTLTAIADYFTANPDQVGLAQAIVHVQTPGSVVVHSPVFDVWYQRHGYLQALADPKQFRFGQYMPIEEFMIALQSFFVPDDTTLALLKIVGNLSEATTVNYQDDGVTQQVQAKTGIARVADVALPNPVTLAPYRTFAEVVQPASRFVFRLQRAEGKPPLAALFEADGGYWQLDAILAIRDWLRAHLPADTVILA